MQTIKNLTGIGILIRLPHYTDLAWSWPKSLVIFEAVSITLWLFIMSLEKLTAVSGVLSWFTHSIYSIDGATWTNLLYLPLDHICDNSSISNWVNPFENPICWISRYRVYKLFKLTWIRQFSLSFNWSPGCVNNRFVFLVFARWFHTDGQLRHWNKFSAFKPSRPFRYWNPHNGNWTILSLSDDLTYFTPVVWLIICLERYSINET